MTRENRHDDPSRVLRRRLALPAAILACLAAAALVTASAPAKPTASTVNSATGLQQDLNALVAAGAPGRSSSFETEIASSSSRPE
jgi:uncharacterized protein involved in exopolysaccharide biosynthesis